MANFICEFCYESFDSRMLLECHKDMVHDYPMCGEFQNDVAGHTMMLSSPSGSYNRDGCGDITIDLEINLSSETSESEVLEENTNCHLKAMKRQVGGASSKIMMMKLRGQEQTGIKRCIFFIYRKAKKS